MIIAIIIGLGVLGVILHAILQIYSKGLSTNINVKETLEQVIAEKGFRTIVKEGSRIRPAFDYDKDQVEIQSGQTTNHVAQGFHELGHAMDAYKKNQLEKEYGFFWGLLFYALKYSLPLAVFSHALVTGTDMDFLIIPTYILIIMSLIFTTITLKEEIVASKYAIKTMKEHLTLSVSEWKRVKSALFGGLVSYIILFVMAYLVLGFQLFNDLYYF